MTEPPLKPLFEAAVLRWAREKAGIPVDVLAERMKDAWDDVSSALVHSWETGAQAPTAPQIKELAKIYKRPTAMFLLAAPPTENDLPPDRRTIGSRHVNVFSPETLLMIRRARRAQALVRELEEDLTALRPFKYRRYGMTDDPIALAREIREDLGISLEAQIDARSYAEFFAYLRAKLESVGIVTLRSGGTVRFPIEDARALSFVDSEPYVILINNKDAEGAKNFSLLHEFAHVLIREAGICNNFTLFQGGPRVQPVEVFCNRFAGEFLVPDRDLLANRMLREKRIVGEDEIDLLASTLAADFKVSRFVILRKLLTLRLITQSIYKSKAAEWEKEPRVSRKGGRNIPSRTAVLNNGPLLSSLVVEAYRRERISSSAVSDYLGVKSKHLPSVIKLVQAYGG